MNPLRSFLYAPGNRPRIMEKAPQAGADAIMFDLADSVPDAEKDTARRLVAQALRELSGRNLYVKLNDAGTPRVDEDVDAVVTHGLNGVLLPNVSDAGEVRALDRALTQRENERGVAPGTVEVILLLETAAAIVRAYELASASPRVVSLCAATAEGGDLIRSLGSAWSLAGPERTYLRGRIMLAARAAGIPWPIDGVYTNLADEAGLESEAALARRFGFRGKLVIHPRQVEPVNRIFTPTAAEIDWSRRVLEAYGDAQERYVAAAVVDGVAVGHAAAAHARETLALAASFT